jgi:hypothetical protein
VFPRLPVLFLCEQQDQNIYTKHACMAMSGKENEGLDAVLSSGLCMSVLHKAYRW